ncbi:YdjA family protein [Hafnia paralvei ATCC 29927]|uniref:PcfJ domain-containing protein n=1 Tax=Hafnia paralvei TaxID=546367 RepID=UPI0007E428EC|nr:PcfJ domain-containing protein [Hafnia paralvei]OAT35719.1 YdjA family protein [Hafnia paralvei ATCC 29927]
MLTKSPLSVHKKTLTINDLMNTLSELKVKRIVRTEENDKTFSVILCGMFKINKNKSNNKISTFKLMYKNSWVWRKTNKIPLSLPIFYQPSTSPISKEWMVKSIKHIVSTLVKQDIELSGGINVILNKKKKLTGSYINNYPMYTDEHEREWMLKNSERREYTLNKEGMYISEFGFVKYEQHNTNHQGIVDAVIQRIPYITDNDYSNAMKSFNLAIRKIIDPNVLSNYISIKCYSFSHNTDVSNLIHTHSVFGITLEHYLHFCELPYSTIDSRLNKLAPFFNIIEYPIFELLRNEAGFNLDKTKTLSTLINIKCLSIKDLKFLRNAPKAYSHFIYGLINNIKRGRNQPLANYINLAMKIFRLNETTHYPTNIVLKVTVDALSFIRRHERLGRRDANTEIENYINNMMMVITRWFEYHSQLYKNIGYRKNLRRWHEEVNYLHHALDWFDTNDVILRKNQLWPSYHRLAEEWTHRYHDNDYYDYRISETWTGLNIEWESYLAKKENLKIREITTFTDLKNEGREMEHCVASYASWCSSGQYRVLSLYLGEERATMGLMRKENSMLFILEQIRGTNNSPVSPEMEKAGKQAIKLINQHISDK